MFVAQLGDVRDVNNTDFVFLKIVYFDLSGSFSSDHCRSLPLFH